MKTILVTLATSALVVTGVSSQTTDDEVIIKAVCESIIELTNRCDIRQQGYFGLEECDTESGICKYYHGEQCKTKIINYALADTNTTDSVKKCVIDYFTTTEN